MTVKRTTAIRRAKFRIARRLLRPWGSISFSQQCEDLTIGRFFDPGKCSGFFVDVGAYHPIKYSNTFLYYLKGWRGINIDPNPATITLFEQDRPDDINVLAAVSDTVATMTYTMFAEGAFNTLDEKEALRLEKSGQTVKRRTEVQTRTLADILGEHMGDRTAIDFLSVDAEGHDLNVLRSNDWSKYRPSVVAVEAMEVYQADRFSDLEVHRFLVETGYRLWACSGGNMLFIQRDP